MISFIVPTVGRPSLQKTLASIECLSGDEILVVGDIEPPTDDRVRFIRCLADKCWGGTERNLAMSQAHGRYLSFMDDDDVYAPGARAALGAAILEAPGCPAIFRMKYPGGMVLWQKQALECGNIGTPMIFVPNVPSKLGVWSQRYESDFNFIESMKWSFEDVVWRTEIIAHLGH